MNSDFARLKSTSLQQSIEKLTAEMEKISGTRQTDDRFWYPSVDKAGNGYSIVRFLPQPAGEDLPFIRMWEHRFKGPTNRWYIENSLTTIGQQDPVSVLNSKLWNSGSEVDKTTARAQKRKLFYLSNVYVVKDDLRPENEGKVFLFKYGKKIFDKLNEVMNPQFADEKPLDPFHLWEGADFKIKIRTVEDFRNYDRSEFATPAPLFSSDEKMEEVWRRCYSLAQFLAPENFKKYDELERKLNEVLGDGTVQATPDARSDHVHSSHAHSNDTGDRVPWKEDSGPQPMMEKRVDATAEAEDEDESMKFFRNIASSD